MTLNEQIGRRIRRRRKIIGLTQSQLAGGCGVSFQQIQKYETGMHHIFADRLFKIAEVLQVEISYFFETTELPRSVAIINGITYERIGA